jgi:hypothetical protein
MKSKMYTVKDLTKMAKVMTRDLKKSYKFHKDFKTLDFRVEITPSGLARLIVPFKLAKGRKAVEQFVNVVL